MARPAKQKTQNCAERVRYTIAELHRQFQQMKCMKLSNLNFVDDGESEASTCHCKIDACASVDLLGTGQTQQKMRPARGPQTVFFGNVEILIFRACGSWARQL